MARAYVALGSNIRPADNLKRAVELLADRLRVVAISTVYETEPEGGRDQPVFYNCVVAVETDLPPAELRRSVLRPIEDRLGRTRDEDKFASRTIDLDLILHDGLAASDPDIGERPYVALPLLELDPALKLPDTGQHISDIAQRLGSAGIRPLPEFTQELRLAARMETDHGPGKS